jgi:outer membrane lipoprotein SlyB
VLVSGCTTTQGIGALGGAATGALIGGLAGGNATGALIGAAAGAAAGWGAAALYEYHVNQSRTVEQDAEIYGYTPGVGPIVKIRDASCSPRTAKAGETVQIRSDYSVNSASEDPVMISEQWHLEKDGEVLHEFPINREPRVAGGWLAENSFELPKDAPPGTYVFVNRIQADDGSEDRRDAVLIVIEG